MATQETTTPETKPVPPLPETIEHGEVSSGASADAQTKSSSANASKRLSLFLDKAKKQFSDKTHKAEDKPAAEADTPAPAVEGESANAEETKAKKRFSVATWDNLFVRSKTPGKDKAEATPAAEADSSHADAEVPVQNDETPASPKDQAKEAAQNVLDQVKRSSTYKKYFGKKSTSEQPAAAEGAAATAPAETTAAPAAEGEETPAAAAAAAAAGTEEARTTTPRDQAKDAAQNVLNQIKRNSTYKKYFGKKSAEEQPQAATAATTEDAPAAPVAAAEGAATEGAATEGAATEEHAKEHSASPTDQAKDAAQNVLNQIKRNSTYKKYFGKKSAEEQPATEAVNDSGEASAAPAETEEHAKEPAASPRDQAKEAAENLIGAIKRNPTYKKYFGKKSPAAHGEEEATATGAAEEHASVPEPATTPAATADEGKKHESTASRAANSPLGRRLTSIIRSFPTTKGNKTTAATEKTEAPAAQDVPATVQATA